jgi:hypothetical protein
MNIFFYTVSESKSAECYLKLLKKLSVLKTMAVLPMEKLFPSRLALKLRRGDLFLLYSGNQHELSDFLIIPIVNTLFDCQKTHLLRPSFVALQDEPIMKIKAVIKKVLEGKMLKIPVISNLLGSCGRFLYFIQCSNSQIHGYGFEI